MFRHTEVFSSISMKKGWCTFLNICPSLIRQYVKNSGIFERAKQHHVSPKEYYKSIQITGCKNLCKSEKQTLFDIHRGTCIRTLPLFWYKSLLFSGLNALPMQWCYPISLGQNLTWTTRGMWLYDSNYTGKVNFNPSFNSVKYHMFCKCLYLI